ncbi:MAG: fatty acid desaturase [Gammaproteobacteria bacterium]|nr:fatty acid desaturase [Gammaproteobacteria bacterium]
MSAIISEHESPATAPRAYSREQVAEVQKTSLKRVREYIRPERYQRSTGKALSWLALDLGAYIAFMAGIFLVEAWWLKLLLGIGAGCTVAMLFVWAHDAAHGALFKNRRTSEVLGTIAMLPSLNMYRLWSHGHNRVHHGFTSFSPMDWIWRPWTPAEYEASSPGQRLLYRLERTPYFCALHYLVRVWWDGMIRFRPEQPGEAATRMRNSKLITLAFAVLMGTAAWVFAGGVVGVIAALVVPFLVFNYFIALFVYLHHTHPDIPFFSQRDEWSQSLGQIYCSTVIRCSRLSEALTHNILIHVPHHVSPVIPFYHIKGAYEDLRRGYAQYIHEYRFSWRTVFGIFRRCKLYDFEQHRWYTFAEGRALAPANSASSV